MVKTKTADEAAKNYQAAISRVPDAYKRGVQAADNVIENAIAAEGLYAEKVQEAIAKGSRVKGLERTSTDAWRKRAAEVGAKNIGTGMRNAAEKQKAGIKRVIEVLQGVELPARTADSMANIDNRLKPIVRALETLKE